MPLVQWAEHCLVVEDLPLHRNMKLMGGDKFTFEVIIHRSIN